MAKVQTAAQKASSKKGSKPRAKAPKSKALVHPQILEADTKVKALMRQLREPEAWLETKKIKSALQLHDAAATLKWGREFKAECEKERKSFVVPLQGVVKGLNAKYKLVTGPVDKITKHIATLMADYDEMLRAKQAKKIEKEAKAAEDNGDDDFAQDLRDNAVREKVMPKIDGLAVKDNWTAEITDLNAVLVAFMEGDAALLNARDELIALFERYLGRVARAIKRENLGTPGCKGVRTTGFERRS
jgi:hypothetical protein